MIQGGRITLFTHDTSSLVRFYVETLGLKLLVLENSASFTVDAGCGFTLEFRQSPTVSSPLQTDAPAIGLGVKIPLSEAIAVYENRGINFAVEQTAGGDRAHFRDPDNHALYLFQVTET